MEAITMKNTLFHSAGIVIVILLGYLPWAHADSGSLPSSTPEAEGISSQAIVDFVEAADKNVDTFDSFMIVRHGKIIAEGWWKPNSADKPHILNSVSKSFNSTAVGLAIHEHKLKLDDPVLKFFPADAPPDPSDNLKAMRVRDLLMMAGGHDVEPKANGGGPSVKQFLAQPVPHQPGTHFLYNTMGSYVLSAIVTKVTGQTTLEYLETRLFAPLGIVNPRWDSSPEGNSLGGYGLYLRTDDMAKFGQLTCKRENGTVSNWFRASGSRKPLPSKFRTRMKAMPRSARIGKRGMVSNSGDAATMPTAPTEQEASSSS